MRFSVLGSLEVSGEEGSVPLGGPKQRIVLAHLVLGVNRVVSAEHLIDALWGEELPEDPKSTLQVYVSRLRSALGPDVVEAQAPGYILRADRDEVDALRFEDLLGAARGNGSDPRVTDEILAEALELWRGPAFADLSGEPSLTGEIARLEELRLQALEEKIDARLELGRHVQVIAELEGLTQTHPLRERLWRELMLALYRSDRQGEALAAFERARTFLAEELGIDPSRDLQLLHERILRQDPELDLKGEPLRGYRLLEQIGEGAFGVVYRATQPQIGREVAIKAVQPELANHPDFVRRFEREAQIVAKLEHPHIVPLYDYWREPDAAYLVMRFLRGGSVEDLLRSGPLEPERASSILDQVAAALSAAHRQGIVHRDVKPGNVLLDEEDNAYLTDFGVALDAGSPERSTGMMIRGTPGYLSPEQVRLDPASPRSDIYALGIVVYEMLTGAPPFPDSSLTALLDHHVRDQVPSVRQVRPDLPAALDFAIGRATAKDEKDRFSDALELAAAVRAALQGDASSVAVPAGDIRNPYKGLRAFLEADAADFFGREAVTQRLLRRLEEDGPGSRFLAVVGPSGSGKSSVVRAGLVPALRRGSLPGSERWYVIDMLPGPHPLRQLESALLGLAVAPPPSLLDELEGDARGLLRAVDRVLPDPDAELLIVLDQFEEVFTLIEDEDERFHILESLRAATTEAGSRVRVVATLRADFFDQPLSVRGFGDLLAQRTEAITPMSPEELERAIVAPAERTGLSVEPRLLAAMIADVVDRPGALPLLQFTLTELAERREDGVLTLVGYRRIGGVSGALARRAEQLFEAMGEGARDACRQVFLRLVTLGEGSDDTRRRVRRSELQPLADARTLDGVLDAFGRYRLLSFDRDPTTREPTVEIAHEALLGAWDRLSGWIDEARDDIRTQRRLAAAVAEWEAAERDPSYLLRGARLDQVHGWVDTTTLALSDADRAYVAEGVEVQRAVTEAERALERRSVRRLRSLVALGVAAALVATTLTVVAVKQRGRAEEEARVSRARELAAAAVANLDVDAERSILLAMAAVDTTRSVDGSVLPEAEDALHRAVGASRIVRSFPGVGGDLDWSSTGEFVTTGHFANEGLRDTGVIDIRGAGSGEILRTFSVDDQGFQRQEGNAEVAFSADGSMLAVTGRDGALKVFDQATGDLLSSVPGSSPAWGPSISADGSLAAAVWDRGPGDTGGARVVDLSTQRILTLPAPPESNATALSPDGKQLAVASGTPPGVVWVTDIATGHVRELPNPGRYGFSSIAWSPDGRYIAAGGWEAAVPVWDARGTLRFVLTGHTDGAHWLDWSPDSSALVTGSDDGTARVWGITDHGAPELMTLAAQEGVISGVAFSGDGTQVMTGSETSAIKIWDVGPTGDAEWAHVPNDGDVTFARTGRELVTSSVVDGKVTVLDLDTGEQRQVGSVLIYGAWPSVEHDLSPDGSSIAIRYGSTPLSPRLSVRDVATGDELFAVDGDVGEVDWSPSGEYLAVGHRGSVSIYDRSGHEVVSLPGGDGGHFGPHGLIATYGANEPIDIWDWQHEEVIATLPGADEQVAFDASGQRIVTEDLEIWDVASEKLSLRLPYSLRDVTVAFSPDGTRLAVGSGDEVRVFDARSGAALQVFRHRAAVEVFKVVFSPDGSMLASWADDGTRVWALDIDDLLDIARANVTRSLSDEECRQYLHVAACPDA
ncbi:MAG TPA: BTAD domain-containing putative transcriptional regulator [Actinomycetota bacterium]|nr:BTAD domain-containing putative transcriptional regulator [Actinomycetota bacterium]